MRYRASIIGPEGTGKTTLLEQLIPHLEQLGLRTLMLRLRLEQRQFAPDEWTQLRQHRSPDDAVLIDSADLLGRLSWYRVKRLTRRCGALVVASHARVLLPPLIHTTTSPALLRQLIDSLPSADVSDEEVHRLFTIHNGNLRAALRELYDLHASSPSNRVSHM